MRRTLPLLVGIALVLAVGVAHGLWTERWGSSPQLHAAAARLEHEQPGNLGPWLAKPAELPSADALRRAGVERAWACTYTHRYSRRTVTVLVLCGRAGPLTKHRPEHCYPGAGYEMTAAPTSLPIVPAPNTPVDLFRVAAFTRHDVTGDAQFRIFWSWYAGGSWQAPESPRWSFARQPYLVKLYVLRELPERPESPEQDPAIDLIKRLTPELSRILKAEGTPG
jgi:hypothetical protein